MKDNIKKYKKQLINMLYASIDNDLEKWSINGRNETDFISQSFGEYKLNIDTERHKFFLKIDDDPNYLKVCSYRFLFIPIKFKMNRYANILKNKKKIINFKKCVNLMEQVYVKEVRKEKLENINK